MRSSLLFTLSLLLASTARAGPDFTRDVRPILSRHCFKCHGPDDKGRKAKLRLDLRESALAGGRSGAAAVVPGKPDDSEVVRRLFAEEETERMPPASVKSGMTDAERQTLKKWIAEGAEYRTHWSLVAPRQSPLPPVRQAAWPRNSIDHFVLARLETEGLRPSPEADRHTLVRRVHLDLVGLPPAPDEADAFVNDTRPDAYERLVDRLLSSPHYGERWARRWLDLARYADTNGYEKDRVRSIWPWRDWVIRAINAGMPFDQFTVEQLAGDLLPGPTLSQRIATGFHRNTMVNEEGGIDPLEFRYHAVVDRVATTGTVWLGLTVGCAQCHTHKFDPIPHREYFRLMAFLNNADEPQIDVPDPDTARRRAPGEAEVARLEAGLPDRFPGGKKALDEKFEAWLKDQRGTAVRWTVLRPAKMSTNLPLLTVQVDGSVLASGDATKHDSYTLTFDNVPAGVTALRLEALPHDSLPARGPGRAYYEGPRGDFLLSELKLSADSRPLKLTGATESYAKLGLIDGPSSAALALDGMPHTGWAAAGREGKASQAVFPLTEPLPAAKELKLDMLFDRHYAAGLGCFRVSVTTDSRPARARGLDADLEDLLLLPPERLTADQRQRLLRHYVSVAPELKAARDEIDKVRRGLPAYATTLVLQERPANDPRPTFIHNRGEFLQPGEKVEPGGLSVLHPLPQGQDANRLTFARWLVDPANPLVGRVTVNRHWAAFFGRGLVRTTEDFGYQGEAPSHPELLDWLAVELVRSGWSLKHIHRLIVTSAAYRQSSRVTPDLLQKDADNRLLGRGPRFRLEAEQIRDAVLSASGLLSRKLGGPSVFPPQPPGVTTEGAYGRLEWKVSAGPDRYRRGLYTFAKRTTPYAMFGTFDGPSGESCVARREQSNTPLQALTMLNDTVLTEAAQALGRLALARSGSDDERLVDLFRRCLIRPPTTEEKSLLLRFREAQLARLRKDDRQAAALAGPGPDTGERAAWVAVARALLNLDEFVTKE